MSSAYFDVRSPNTNVSSILFVEGPDDGYFLDALLSDLQIGPDDLTIHIARGKDRIGSVVGAVLKSASFTTGRIKRYAIIRDADNDFVKAEGEVHRQLSALNEPKPNSGQLLKRSDNRTVGLFLFPDVGQNGDLETICMASVANAPLLQASENFITDASHSGGYQDHPRKRVAQSFLAASTIPMCAGVGWAARQASFDLRSPAMSGIRDFIQRFVDS